jgi:hypothetical protein
MHFQKSLAVHACEQRLPQGLQVWQAKVDCIALQQSGVMARHDKSCCADGGGVQRVLHHRGGQRQRGGQLPAGTQRTRLR